MWERKRESVLLLSVILTAFALRLVLLFFSMDIPGDGPTRAILAYTWSQSPYILTHDGAWLPGFMYLAGLFSFLVSNPLVSTRIFNLIIGTLTVPIFYLLVHRVYGRAPALFSVAVLAFLPLHLGLSASSLSEPGFLFAIIAGTTLLIAALDNRKTQRAYLALSLLCVYWAVTARYEAWLLIPLFPSYYYWKTRSLLAAMSIFFFLLTFPISLLLGNYLHSGDFLPFLHSQLKAAPKAMGAVPVDLPGALRIVGRQSVSHLGWVLLLGLTPGAIWQLVQAIRGHIHAERALYTLMVLIFWTFTLSFATFRGTSLVDRNLLFGFVLTLPFALIPFALYLRTRPRWLVLMIFVALVSVGFAHLSRRPEIYVTTKQPTEIKRIVAWLETSPYRDHAILLTRMGWQSTYVPLYLHKSKARYLIVSFWTEDSELEEFLTYQQPSLLITRDGDEEFQSRIEVLLGWKTHPDRLVYVGGKIKIYALRLLGEAI